MISPSQFVKQAIIHSVHHSHSTLLFKSIHWFLKINVVNIYIFLSTAAHMLQIAVP